MASVAGTLRWYDDALLLRCAGTTTLCDMICWYDDALLLGYAGTTTLC